ncbi:hypothetical protein [Denitromonas halophila]|uniref:Uncharacterized protein n=1 Tax=Denitromonas halophila TaxID=1629404 RepID=A0A557R0N6_9RHOO|nr:hypothetical protein [Denitromonas halophila]TVO58718.1 hypothetical protein FHP91_03385 [Denitromonas halophila]
MIDYETWLLDTGDVVIQNKAAKGYDSLPSVEKAVYCLWVIDYAIRNSGTLEPVFELHPTSLQELSNFAASETFPALQLLLESLGSPEAEEKYYSLFSAACSELATRYGHT